MNLTLLNCIVLFKILCGSYLKQRLYHHNESRKKICEETILYNCLESVRAVLWIQNMYSVPRNIKSELLELIFNREISDEGICM